MNKFKNLSWLYKCIIIFASILRPNSIIMMFWLDVRSRYVKLWCNIFKHIYPLSRQILMLFSLNYIKFSFKYLVSRCWSKILAFKNVLSSVKNHKQNQIQDLLWLMLMGCMVVCRERHTSKITGVCRAAINRASPHKSYLLAYLPFGFHILVRRQNVMFLYWKTIFR